MTIVTVQARDDGYSGKQGSDGDEEDWQTLGRLKLTGPGATTKILEVMRYHFCVAVLKSEIA